MKPQSMLLTDYLDTLQSKGKYTFTKANANEALNLNNNAFNNAAHRLMKKKRLVSGGHGFYIIVPLEYQTNDAPPPDWYVDALMSYHNQPYYVGLLSAAAMHGAAHQQPQIFQIITNKALRPLQIGRAHIEFYTKKNISQNEYTQIKVPTGYMFVSTPEKTAIDLVQYQKASGYLNNIATVLSELKEKINSEYLLQAVKNEVKLSTVQRLGYLLQLVDAPKELTLPLQEWLKIKKPRLIPLRADKPFLQSEKNNDWKIYINEKVEADI